MKKLFPLLIGCLFSFIVFGQDVEYKLNARTGKFDLVRSSQWLNKNISFNGKRAVTRSGLPAINTMDSNLVDWVNNYFFPATNPATTLSVTGGLSREFMASGSALTVDISWTVTRPIACLPISSITVNGVASAPNPITEGQTQTGTLTGQTLNKNINATYTINAVASDGKTGSSSQTITWFWKRYWGAFASAYPPTDVRFAITDAQILALTGAGVGTGNELSTTRVKTLNNINASGNYLVFAWPASWGNPQFVINGLINTAFTKVRSNSFTNGAGGITNYDVWVSSTTQASEIAQFQIN